MTEDPDGIGFFTTGDEPSITSSVFGAAATERLDALFSQTGEDGSALPTAPPTPQSVVENTFEPVQTVAIVPAMSDWKTAFILGGPAAAAPYDQRGRSR